MSGEFFNFVLSKPSNLEKAFFLCIFSNFKAFQLICLFFKGISYVLKLSRLSLKEIHLCKEVQRDKSPRGWGFYYG